jgi:hypothetical protein
MESIKCELKYCEGCGTLKLRPVESKGEDCAICERMLTRFRFPRALVAKNHEKLRSAAILRKTPLAVGGAMPAGRPQ